MLTNILQCQTQIEITFSISMTTIILDSQSITEEKHLRIESIMDKIIFFGQLKIFSC
jgi:hypothetical protein